MKSTGLRIPESMKRVIASASALTLSPFRFAFSGLRRGRAIVFMLHRFADPQFETGGHDPELLRSVLRALRRERVPILSLKSVVDGLLEGQPVEGIAFTVDDGYHDFASVGAPVFQEFECPVTVFLTTGFIDNLYWFWWDRVAFAVARTEVPSIPLPSIPGAKRVSLATEHDRSKAATTITRWIKSLPQLHREAAVEEVIGALRVMVPHKVPAGFQAMSWSDVRRLSRSGVDFAPHSVSHPSMATLGVDETTIEVRESFKRIKEEVSEVVPVFCYPYGLASDVATQTAETVEAEGLTAAVTAIPGYVGLESTSERFTLPRFGYPNNMIDTWQVVSGFERAKTFLRSRLSRRHRT